MTLEQLESLLVGISDQGFSLPQTRALLALRDGKLSMTEIAKKTGNSTAATTGGVDLLEKRGLVVRSRPEIGDRRTIYVTLTLSGEAAIHSLSTIALSVN